MEHKELFALQKRLELDLDLRSIQALELNKLPCTSEVLGLKTVCELSESVDDAHDLNGLIRTAGYFEHIEGGNYLLCDMHKSIEHKILLNFRTLDSDPPQPHSLDKFHCEIFGRFELNIAANIRCILVAKITRLKNKKEYDTFLNIKFLYDEVFNRNK